MQRRILPLLVLPVLVLSACGGVGPEEEGGGDDGGPITVGVSLPLTGDFADPGAGIQRGYELWAEQVNADGGLLGRDVELTFLDDGSEPDKAVADYERLITQDQVDLVFGPFSSRLVIPTSEVAEREQMLFVEPAGASPEVFERGLEYLFYAAPATADRHGELVAEYLLDLPADQRPTGVAYTKLDDPFAMPIAEGVQAQLEEAGIPTVLDETYPPEQTNFQPLAAQIRDSGADVLIAGSQDVDAIGLVRALRELGHELDLVMMSTGPTLPDFDEEVGGAEGILAPVGYTVEAAYPSNAEFVAAYRDKHGEDPSEDPANGYTVGQIVGQAVEEVGCADPSADCQTQLRDYVRETTFDTIVGPIGFDETGAPTGNHMILQWQQGEIEIVLAPEEDAVTAEIVHPKPGW
jgi:branched-chain amino acid transport system substrate-binding protein